MTNKEDKIKQEAEDLLIKNEGLLQRLGIGLRGAELKSVERSYFLGELEERIIYILREVDIINIKNIRKLPKELKEAMQHPLAKYIRIHNKLSEKWRRLVELEAMEIGLATSINFDDDLKGDVMLIVASDIVIK